MADPTPLDTIPLCLASPPAAVDAAPAVAEAIDVVAPAVTLEVPPVQRDTPTVAAYLREAREAHGYYRALANDPVRYVDQASQQAQLIAARDARKAADALDPDHLDPAWSEDRALNGLVESADLLAFYDRVIEP